MEKQEFETFWKANRERILMSSDEYIKATSSYKLSSGADWLLFAIPISLWNNALLSANC